MPDGRRHVVLEARDPLRTVLVRARGLDDALVVLAGRPGQRQALAGLLGLLLALGVPGGVTRPVTLIDRVQASGEQRARIVGQGAGQLDALAGLGGAAAPGGPQAHLAPLASRG